jgi:hypothetical protein
MPKINSCEDGAETIQECYICKQPIDIFNQGHIETNLFVDGKTHTVHSGCWNNAQTLFNQLLVWEKRD